ncbi:MAG: hypothetical protein AAGA77_07820 [Bacteroidota bacterium]
MKYLFLLASISMLFFSCIESVEQQNLTRKQLVENKAKDFFQTFAERQDWKKFCAYYREDLEFKDVLLQLDLDSLWQLKRFYKWDEEGDRFKKLTPDQEHLSLNSLVANDSVAVACGKVNPFYYDGTLIDTDWGMEFTIWLYFDENLLITQQIDWFEYDSYTLESMIKRCRENGFEAIPEWLDLSKRN